MFLVCASICMPKNLCADQSAVFKPFMLFVTHLTPPPNTFSKPVFTERVTKELRAHFDTTSYQVIMVDDTAMASSMSNHKRDIILNSDPTDLFYKGSDRDTLVIWANFKTGFTLGRIAVEYNPQDTGSLPLLAARHINEYLRSEFLGEVYFEGGPKGFSVEVIGNHKLHPPRMILLPAGSFFIKSSYPGFPDRKDTINVLRGDFIRKRILMLPN